MMKSTKHIPMRTCVACRNVRPKQELIRLVRVTDGSIDVDDAGKIAGRGAYLCPVAECWSIGLKGGRLEHTLRTHLNQDNREQLIQYAENLRGIN
ncbi:RNase P modulator RnpM [Chloroflexota bacterium]